MSLKQPGLLVFILFIYGAAFAQDLKGTWKGELSQQPSYTYYFEIRIDQQMNGTISGTTYIESSGNSFGKKGDFGTIAFTGKINGSSIIINETRIIKEARSSSIYYWCIKNLKLRLSQNGNTWTLSGPWTSYGTCAPGDLTVSKPVKKNLDSLENRVVNTKFSIKVKSPSIHIQAYDQNMVDGDIISLNLNGDWILEKYSLVKEKKSIPVTFTETTNILIMHAENLGEYAPNTAAIIIDDGVTEQKIILNSDTEKSEAIKITVEP